MNAGVIWLILGLGLLASELLSGQFVLLMLGGGALAGAGAAFLVGGPLLGPAGTVGGLVFVVVSLLLVVAVRPSLQRRLAAGLDDSLMHSRALVGQSAVVLARVDEKGGRVKIGGDVWSARPVHDDDVIEAGATVLVVEITGATAVVVAQH